jgi:WD40 repeat protein
MQFKEFIRGRKLAACMYHENRVVIHDLETGDQMEINVNNPWKCAASQYFFAVTTSRSGLHLFSADGVLVHIVPDSTEAYCVAFHPRNTNILAMGYLDGTVRLWNVLLQAYVSSIRQHYRQIPNIRFTSDCRLFMSSYDNDASIATLDDQFQIVSSVNLEGHTDLVNDIIPLPDTSQCVTCSDDDNIKVWDCETGACLRTLTQHTDCVTSLAMHPNGQHVASGSYDRSVIIWSSETFAVLHHIPFPSWAQSLVFGESDTLYVGVHDHGLMSCNALTGETGRVIVSAILSVGCLALGKSHFCSPQYTPLTHTRNSTVPAPKPWTPSTHSTWPLPAQHIVHMAVVVLWKVRYQGRLMQVPYELVEIILRHVQ